MSSLLHVTRHVALAETALGRADRTTAGRHLSDAAEAALRLAAAVHPGPQRDHLAGVAGELVESYEQLAVGAGGRGPRPTKRFTDIAGLEEAKSKLREMVILPLQRPDIAERYCLGAGGGVLMYGPPGTGKTEFACALAGELDAPFKHVSGADIRSKWHGESEQNLHQIFAELRAHKLAVLFLDDMDGLLPCRGPECGADNRLVTQFLQEVGGFAESENALVLLGATNNPWDIDPAVLRSCRFDHKIYIGLPDPAAREFILRQKLGEVPVDPDLDLPSFAARLEGYAGSDLKAIAVDAIRVAAHRCSRGEPGDVTLADLEGALRTIPPSANRQLMARYEEYARSTRA